MTAWSSCRSPAWQSNSAMRESAWLMQVANKRAIPTRTTGSNLPLPQKPAFLKSNPANRYHPELEQVLAAEQQSPIPSSLRWGSAQRSGVDNPSLDSSCADNPTTLARTDPRCDSDSPALWTWFC